MASHDIDAIERQMRRAERQRRSAIVATSAAAVIGVVLLAGVGFWVHARNAASAERPVRVENSSLVSSPGASSNESVAASDEETAAVAPSDPVEQTPTEVPNEAAAEPAVAEQPDPAPKKPSSSSTSGASTKQRISIAIGDAGYEPTVVTAKAGSPIELTVGKGEGCAAGFLIADLGIAADNSSGPAKVSLPALSAGTYRFTCGMEMVEGRLVVQ